MKFCLVFEIESFLNIYPVKLTALPGFSNFKFLTVSATKDKRTVFVLAIIYFTVILH